MKLSFTSLVVVSLILSFSFLESSMADPSYCGTKCGQRCALAGNQKRCLKYCGICCQKCNCVPSGTYGNKSECACYNSLLNSKGKSKCP